MAAGETLPLEGVGGGHLLYETGRKAQEQALPPLVSAIRVSDGWVEAHHMLLSRGAALDVAGVATGLLGSYLLVGTLGGLLFGVSPTDPGVHLTVTLVLLGVVLLASYAPARRASRIDPAEALRSR